MKRDYSFRRSAFAALLLSVSVPAWVLPACRSFATDNTVIANDDDAKKSTDGKLADVRANAPDEPRDTPLTRPAMKQYIEDLKNRTPRIPLPELTDEEKKKQLEDPRAAGYEGRLRTLFLNDNASGGYNGFGGSPRTPSPNANRINTPPEPKLTLDYAFKVRLFWIAARANNCQYCLGHQESKLLAAGMDEDAIAALDGDWGIFPPDEQAAFALAKRLTNEPHLLSQADIDAVKAHYNDLQILEMVGSVAGNNAINRWKEGTGVPQSSTGGNFGGGSASTRSGTVVPAHDETHSYLTPTSSKYQTTTTRVAKLGAANVAPGRPVAPTRCERPSLETGAALTEALAKTASRTPRLPLVSEAEAREVLGDLAPSGEVPQWMRLLANFPVAGKRFVTGITASQQVDGLTAVEQAKIDWVVARQDRAWYAVAVAKEQLKALGVNDAEIEALDGDISIGSSSPLLTSKEKAVLTVAKNLAASPIVLTDKQVANAIELVGPRVVTQTINYTTYRAAFDRITEAAGLSK